MAEKLDLSELGSTGLRHAGGTIYEEFLVALRAQNGQRVYREMADNDPVIGSILYAIEKVIVRLDWRVDPYLEPNSEGAPKDKDAEVADFIESCLHDMSDSWDATLSSILSMLPFGFSFHELVYKRRVGPEEKDSTRKSNHHDGKIGWRKFAIRSQESLTRWHIAEDGGIQAMTQNDPSGGGTHTIPIEKALLFRTTATKNNPEGRSLLRNAYRPYYFKKRVEEIEAIGIERDLAGLPVAYVPPEYLSSTATDAQKAVLNSIVDIVQNIKRNEQEGVVFPAQYDESGQKLFDLTLLSTGGNRQFDTDKIISRYDQRISMSVLSDFILLGHDQVGSFSLGTAKMDLWSMSVDAIAKNIAETINNHAIPRLMRLNGMDVSRLPILTYGEVAHIDLTEISNYVTNLANAGIIITDPNLEDYLRQLGGLPPAEHDAESTGAVDGMPAEMPEDETSEEVSCPPATQDVGLNLKNRKNAIDTAMYGPLNPAEPNREYWQKLADEWSVDVEVAKQQRCGNCAVFNISPSMKDCIESGLTSDSDTFDAIDTAGELGYCEAFDFKCASARTCRAWVSGGPITEEDSTSDNAF